jgi:biotin carboxylase
MTEHVLIVGKVVDIPDRIGAHGLASGREFTISVLCWPDQVAKIKEPGVQARIVAVRPDAPDAEWIAFARAIHDAEPVKYIGSFADECQREAALVGEALGVPTYSPRTVRLVVDKHAMREHLAEAGVDATAACLVRDIDDLHSFASRNGYPYVVKPLDGTSSRGVSVVPDEGAAAAALARAKDAVGATSVLAEAFLFGDQYSVEAFSEGGRHVVVAITRKYSDPVSLVELGHVLPAPLDAEQTTAITRYVNEVLDVLGVQFGPTHTEIVLTGNGPRLIETHLRLGGDDIWLMVTDATGVDLAEYQVLQCIGEKVADEIETRLRDRPRAHEAICFAGAPSAGLLVEVTGADGPHPDGVKVDVLRRPNDQLAGLQNSDARLAQARARAATADEAVRLAREAIARLQVVTRTPLGGDDVV